MTSDRRPFELHKADIPRARPGAYAAAAAHNASTFDYQQVKGRRGIIDFLQATMPMPPMPVGGPWPKTIDLFVRWTKLDRPARSSHRVKPSTRPRRSDRYELSGT
jgi:hypothetical protein